MPLARDTPTPTPSVQQWPERATPQPQDADIDHLDGRFTANASVFMASPTQEGSEEGSEEEPLGDHDASDSDPELGASTTMSGAGSGAHPRKVHRRPASTLSNTTASSHLSSGTVVLPEAQRPAPPRRGPAGPTAPGAAAPGTSKEPSGWSAGAGPGAVSRRRLDPIPDAQRRRSAKGDRAKGSGASGRHRVDRDVGNLPELPSSPDQPEASASSVGETHTGDPVLTAMQGLLH